jgi:hypothetical protein
VITIGMVFWFFFQKFWEGFGVAVLIRVLIALFIKQDVSFKGLMVSGITGGVILASIVYYVVVTTVV